MQTLESNTDKIIDYVENTNYSKTNHLLNGVNKRLVKMFEDNNRIMSYENIMEQIEKYM